MKKAVQIKRIPHLPSPLFKGEEKKQENANNE
jgi:hypothetical protein